MANSRRAVCRKCMDFVSRIGSTTPTPPAPTTSGRGDGSPSPESFHKNSVLPAVVIVVSLVAVIGIIVVIGVWLRRKRIHDQASSRAAPGAVEVAADVKGGEGGAKPDEIGNWGAVELVVMAGESSPSFVAHAVPVLPVVQSRPLPKLEIPSTEPEPSREPSQELSNSPT